MSIAETIVAVMGDIHAVEKNGFNAHFKFKYQSWDDVLPAVKTACVQHHLAIVPSVQSVVRTEGKVTVSVDYHLITGDQSMVVSFAGESLAPEKDDKAIQKAITSATKFFYLKTFMIPIEGEEDPDGASPKTSPNMVTQEDANTALRNKGWALFTKFGGNADQFKALERSLKGTMAVGAFLCQAIEEEGCDSLQSVYDYAISAFAIQNPFTIGGQAS